MVAHLAADTTTEMSVRTAVLTNDDFVYSCFSLAFLISPQMGTIWSFNMLILQLGFFCHTVCSRLTMAHGKFINDQTLWS